MKKLVFGALLGLLAFGLSPARAQFSPFYNRPQTNPLQAPFFNPYTNPYTTPYGNYGGGLGAPYGGALAGTPGYAGPGIFGSAVTGTTLTTPVANLGDPSMTGHPTRFMDYGGYFFNQGGTVAATPGTRTGTTLPTGATAPGGQTGPQTAIGTSPLRGKSSTSKPGS